MTDRADDQSSHSDSVDAQAMLRCIHWIAVNDSPDSSAAAGNAVMFDGRGDLSPLERQVLCITFAWACAREMPSWLRNNLADVLDVLSDDIELPAPVLALVAAEAAPSSVSSVNESLCDKLNSALATSGHTLETLTRTRGFRLFAAPYWPHISSGLTRPAPPLFTPRRPTQSISAPIDLVDAPRIDALRERRVARRTVAHLADHDMIDAVSRTAVTAMLHWSAVAQPTEPDVPEILELLERLRAAATESHDER